MMGILKGILFAMIFSISCYAQQILVRNIPEQVSLRGISAVNDSIAWVSGSDGKVYKTLNGGNSWTDVSPAESYNQLQFRDIENIGKDTAFILSAGLPAVILKTTNGGELWREVYRNEKEGVFFDAMDFWDSKKGIAFSDAAKDKLLIITTVDGGNSWQELDNSLLPKVHEKQGGFAASGTCIRTYKNGKVVIGLGGEESLILISEDYGHTWHKRTVPIDDGAPSKGIFSLAFIDEFIILACGGDYRSDSLSTKSFAFSLNGGYHWENLSYTTPIDSTYRSAVHYSPYHNAIICSSRTGLNISSDGAINWSNFKEASYYSISEGKDGAIWLSGPEGKVARLILK